MVKVVLFYCIITPLSFTSDSHCFCFAVMYCAFIVSTTANTSSHCVEMRLPNHRLGLCLEFYVTLFLCSPVSFFPPGSKGITALTGSSAVGDQVDYCCCCHHLRCPVKTPCDSLVTGPAACFSGCRPQVPFLRRMNGNGGGESGSRGGPDVFVPV